MYSFMYKYESFINLDMKSILFFLLFFTGIAYGQEKADAESIARMEKDAHQNQFINAARLTAESDNFDVKYYRCEWTVDPAVRFIDGKVTVYFKPISALSSITLDMQSPLVADSIKRNGSPLRFAQTRLAWVARRSPPPPPRSSSWVPPGPTTQPRRPMATKRPTRRKPNPRPRVTVGAKRSPARSA